MASSSTTSSASAGRKADFRVEPDAPLFVASAVLGTAALGGTAGAVLGVMQRASPIAYAASTAINSGVAGLAFFGMREYLVSPVLVGLRATEGHAARADSPTGEIQKPTVGQIRTQRLLDSAIAGALAGGAVSAGMRGPRTFIPAAFTSALLTTAAQFGVNEVRVVRLKLLARRVREAEAPRDAVSDAQGEELPPVPGLSEALDDRIKAPDARRGDSPLTQRALDALSRVLPIRKITDDEYIATMEKRQREIEKRLTEIDAEQAAMFERSQQFEKQGSA